MQTGMPPPPQAHRKSAYVTVGPRQGSGTGYSRRARCRASRPQRVLQNLLIFAKLAHHKLPRAGLSRRGAEMMYGDSARFTAVVKQDITKWAKVVKETGARAD